MNHATSRIAHWISSRRSHMHAALLLLLALPLLMLVEIQQLPGTAERPRFVFLLLMGLAFLLLAFGFISFLEWTFKGLERGNRFLSISHDMFCIAGMDGYFRCLNSSWQRVLGFTSQELMSRPWIEFVHPEDRSTLLTELETLKELQVVHSFQLRWVCANGDYKWLRWNIVSMPAQREFFGAVRDVTEAAQEVREVAAQRVDGPAFRADAVALLADDEI